MSNTFAIISLLELVAFILIITAVIFEKKLIAFEEKLGKIIRGNYKRIKRLSKKRLINIIYYIDKKRYDFLLKKQAHYTDKLIGYKFF